MTTLRTEVEKYKKLYFEIEQTLSETTNNYDRDKTLWEGKYNFLVQQKQQAKQTLQEAQKKFEQTLQHLQKHRKSDKRFFESSHNVLVQQVEKRY